MKTKTGILQTTIALSAAMALASMNASAQQQAGRPGPRPPHNRPTPPSSSRCVFSGGRRTAEVDRVMNADGRGVESINVRNRLNLGRECAGVKVDELRVFVSATRDRQGRRTGAELSLVLDGRRTGASQRVIPGQQAPLVFRFPANEDQLGAETRKIEIEVRGKAYVDTIELIADRRHGGFDDDGRVEDSYTYNPVIGDRTLLGQTTPVDLRAATSTIVPGRKDYILKGLELKAMNDDYQILKVVVRFADHGSEKLELGRKLIPENSSVYVDFEGSRFHDVRAVSSIEITGKQVEMFDKRPHLRVIGIEARRGGPGGGPGRRP